MKLGFVDVETTGLSAKKNRVIEVSIALVDEDSLEILTMSTHRFQPTAADMRYAHPKALEVNGYREGHPDWVGTPYCGDAAACEEYDGIAKKLEYAILTNQNAPFDRRFLWHELIRHGVKNRAGKIYDIEWDESGDGPWARRHIEIMTFSKAVAQEKGLKGWSLAEVYDALHGPTLPPHRAEADVFRAMWVYAHGMERTAGINVNPLRDQILKLAAR